MFAGLALLATVPVHFHLAAIRKAQLGGAKGPSSTAKQKITRPCPQCGHATDETSAFCEKCGVPMMLWKLKLAREATGNDASRSAHPRPIVHQDLCIGCGSCSNACPENVLEIIAGKSTVVNASKCTGVAACAEVCPTSACKLTGQGAARRVEVPQIDANFETNQRGIFAVGELGGLGLIKNAVNEGQLVVDKLKPRITRREGILDLLIIGAGPAGLSAGLAAKEAGLDALILEQGSFADTIRRFPNRKIVMAEPVRVPMYGSLWISDAPKETLLSVWETIIRSAKIPIRENEMVLDVRRNGSDAFHVQTSKGQYMSQNVVLAIGKRGSPRKLGVDGEDLPKVMYALTDAAQYTGVDVLVVGGGDSAAEAAIGLARQEGNRVTLSYRKKEFTRMRDKNRAALEQCIQEGSVQFLPASQVVEVHEQDVDLRCEDGRNVRLPNDHIFALLGGESPNQFLQKIGISLVTKEVSVEGPESGRGL